MKLIIKNGHLVDPKNGLDKVATIYIDKNKIVAIGEQPKGFSSKKEIDANGQYIFPGIIDLSVRLREPGEEHKATIVSESKAAIYGGITHLVCPPDTYPIIDTPAMVHMMRDRATEAGYAKVHPMGALTLGLKGERLTDMAMLSDAGCVALSNATQAIENTLVMRRAMQYASTFCIPVFLNPSDRWLQGNGVVHEGAMSTMLGLPAIPEAAETVGVARDLAIIETSGAKAHFEQISCARSVTMISEAQTRDLPVTAAVAIHQLLFTEDDIGSFDSQYKVMPPFRSKQDRQALIQGVQNGHIAVICSDHQPHGADAKLAPFSEAAIGISGLDSLLSLAYGLVLQDKLQLKTMVAALTCNPANIIGLDAGHLSVGSETDLCIFDPNMSWVLNNTTMRSQGHNSPCLNQTLQGKVSMTIANGKIYSN